MDEMNSKPGVVEMVDGMAEDDLYKLRSDLSKGGRHLKKIVEEKIRALESRKSGYCVTCGRDLAKQGSSFTLLFGPDEFKKKAGFCELDCLEYFMNELKSIQNKKYNNVGGNEYGVQKTGPDV